jgi:hypothetical protein
MGAHGDGAAELHAPAIGALHSPFFFPSLSPFSSFLLFLAIEAPPPTKNPLRPLLFLEENPFVRPSVLFFSLHGLQVPSFQVLESVVLNELDS